MRVALISDIHGNLVALEAALADIAREGADRIVCLGDVAEFGPQPREVLARLREVGCPVVMGNTDERLLDPARPEALGRRNKRSDQLEAWAIGQLGPEDRAFIATFRPTVELDVDGMSLVCCHGSPRSNRDEIYPTTSDVDLERMLADVPGGLVAGGHTHRQFLRRFRELTFVNPGSVGLPFEERRGSDEVRNPPWAEYALVQHEAGRLAVELRRAPVDLERVRRAALESDMPHAGWWAKDWME